MDDAAGRQAAVESLLENEALTAGLDDEAARALLDWGIANLQHLPGAEPEAPAENIQEAGQAFQRTNRRLLRLASRWTSARQSIGMAEQLDSLAQVLDLAYGLHPGAGLPSDARRVEFLEASLALPPADFINALRAFAEGR